MEPTPSPADARPEAKPAASTPGHAGMRALVLRSGDCLRKERSRLPSTHGERLAVDDDAARQAAWRARIRRAAVALAEVRGAAALHVHGGGRAARRQRLLDAEADGEARRGARAAAAQRVAGGGVRVVDEHRRAQRQRKQHQE